MYMYTYICIYIHTRIYEFITVAIRDWRNGVWRTLVLVDSGEALHTYTYMYIYMYIYVYIHTCVCIHIYVYIYTHTYI